MTKKDTKSKKAEECTCEGCKTYKEASKSKKSISDIIKTQQAISEFEAGLTKFMYQVNSDLVMPDSDRDMFNFWTSGLLDMVGGVNFMPRQVLAKLFGHDDIELGDDKDKDDEDPSNNTPNPSSLN